jgi:hypothetical protein
MSSGWSKTTVVEHAAIRTLVPSRCTSFNCHSTGGGTLFIEDVCSNPSTFFVFHEGQVFARQLNVENQGTHILNDGGRLWILGLKTERGGTTRRVKRGEGWIAPYVSGQAGAAPNP